MREREREREREQERERIREGPTARENNIERERALGGNDREHLGEKDRLRETVRRDRLGDRY